MKVLLLSKTNSVHTVRWANALSQKGIEVIVFGLETLKNNEYDLSKVKIVSAGIEESGRHSAFTKAKYIKALPKLKKVIMRYKPDILHAHYASSYGLLGALSSFHPFILSVWGYDVYDFPQKSPVNKKIIEFNLSRTDRITSTSEAMARTTAKFTGKTVDVVPFGVDTSELKPMQVNTIFPKSTITIGTVKALEKKYGVDILIKAFDIVKRRYPDKPLKLLIVGGGSQEENLKQMVKKLGLENDVVFTGKVPHSEVIRYHNMISIFAALSRDESESFGVAVVEAMACEKPVVVSRVGGLPEVVEDGVTGFVVNPEDPEDAADAMERLILNDKLRTEMGKMGRERVIRLYEWDQNVEKMIKIYVDTLVKMEK